MFNNDTRKEFVINKLDDLNRAYELLAKHCSNGYTAEYYNHSVDCNSYWVKGSNCFYLVSFIKQDKKGIVKCSCESEYLCYHIGAVAKHHIAKKQTEQAIKTLPVEVKPIKQLVAIAQIDCTCQECGKPFVSVTLNDFLWCNKCDAIKTAERDAWVLTHKAESAISKKYKQMRLSKKQSLALQALG